MDNNKSSKYWLLLAIATLCLIHGMYNSGQNTNSSVQSSTSLKNNWNGEVLTAEKGTVEGPSGKETFYNLDMNYVIELMHANDKTGKYENYEYWIRNDGVKMFGDYIMVAADLRFRPKGTILKTSLGQAIVVDTGNFVYMYTFQDDETGQYILVPSYVKDPKNSDERIYDYESYVPDETKNYPLSYQIDIATSW